MRATPKFLSCLMVCLTSALIIPQHVKAKEASEPEMVWVSYAAGEVKFSPGHNGKPMLGNDWIEVAEGQAMEDGYTLATEKGRAEIEFENGTVVYLAEGSVLQFKKLRRTGEATETHLSLLSGTATVAHVSRGHDLIQLDTLATSMKVPDSRTLRMEGTLNGTVVQAVEGDVPLSAGRLGPRVVLKAGESAAYVDGTLVALKELKQLPQGDEWDQWVNTRRAERQALIEKGLKETGMKEPIPGLAGMVKNGRFFDCEPYGRCWEPVQSAKQGGAEYVPASTGSGPRNFVINKALVNRCPMEAWMYSVGRPSVPGLLAANEPEQTFTLSGGVGYGTCFAGSWVDACGYPYQMGGWGWAGGCGTQWRWVVGGRERHHHHCHYVKVPHGIGVIPPHPLDQKGKPPINAKSGILLLTRGKGGVKAGVEPAPKGMQLLTSPPSGVERGFLGKAPRVAQPVVQAKLMGDVTRETSLSAKRDSDQKNPTRIQYDYKTKNFVAKENADGNARAGVVAHLGGHDTSVSRVLTSGNGRSSGEIGARGSSHGSGGGSGGGSQSSAHQSSSGSSGSSHASSSGGGNGGGGHSGGSSGGSSTSSASSSTSTSSVGSGGHH